VPNTVTGDTCGQDSEEGSSQEESLALKAEEALGRSQAKR
jgi:hypothetical protein